MQSVGRPVGLEVLSAGGSACILKPDGNEILQKDGIIYLGSLITSDGKVGTELSRRLGAARAEFETLSRVWSHSTLDNVRKLRIFDACVVSKLLYCLHTSFLNKQELRRLDAFQARCLRKILRIPHSYISRVSNECVLQRAGSKPLSNALLRRQLLFLGHVARKPGDDPVRLTVFRPFSHDLALSTFRRRRGRPRKTWCSEIHAHAVRAARGEEALAYLWQDSVQSIAAWHATVTRYCDAL